MDNSTLWWLMAGTAVAVELLTGTFYLLMVAVGLVAGALAAHLGVAVPMQLVLAGAVGAMAVAALHVLRGRRPGALHAGANRDVNLDVGESVHVAAWGVDGTAAVRYRGAQWTALAADGQSGESGMYRVREVVGNRLVLEKV